MRGYLAFDHAKMPGALSRKVHDRFDGQRQHRAPHEVGAFAPEHLFGFGMFAEQPAVDQRREIFATLGGELEAALDRIAWRRHVRACRLEVFLRVCSSAPAASSRGNALAAFEKKSRAQSPALKLCRPYFPENLDLILIDEATLLVRVRAPPETWTTRLQPLGQPEPAW